LRHTGCSLSLIQTDVRRISARLGRIFADSYRLWLIHTAEIGRVLADWFGPISAGRLRPISAASPILAAGLRLGLRCAASVRSAFRCGPWLRPILTDRLGRIFAEWLQPKSAAGPRFGPVLTPRFPPKLTAGFSPKLTARLGPKLTTGLAPIYAARYRLG